MLRMSTVTRWSLSRKTASLWYTYTEPTAAVERRALRAAREDEGSEEEDEEEEEEERAGGENLGEGVYS